MSAPLSEEVGRDGRMKTMLEHVAKQLVDDPAAVVVTEELDGDFIKLHLRVAEGDVGKVIGRGGRIAKAIRALLKVMATRDGTKVNLEID
ncbi:MAG TPA: KH domain-containing protein [Candidatus Limnocylindrales bacterium]|nr:KH domain-containing protein [Candidatus Limnocylindrales bacterium]